MKNLKIFFASPSKNGVENEKEKKTRMGIAKFFALHANANAKGKAFPKLFALQKNTKSFSSVLYCPIHRNAEEFSLKKKKLLHNHIRLN